MNKLIISIDGTAGSGKQRIAKYISKKYNLYLKEAEFLKVKGGSLRLIFQKKFNKESKKLKKLIKQENSILKNMNLKFKDLGQPLRLVLLGTMNGPSLTKIMKVIGKEATLKKIKTNWI